MVKKFTAAIQSHMYDAFQPSADLPAEGKAPGSLVADPACHALFHYAMIMKENLKNHKDPDRIEYETAGDPDINHRQIWVSVAKIYGVQPEEMVKYWPNVDLTLAMNKSETIPEFYKMRSIPEINSEPRKNDA